MQTQILSVITVIDGRHYRVDELIAGLHAEVSKLNVSAEIILVINPQRSENMPVVRAIAERLPNIQVYALKVRVPFETAVMAGMENAIGDWIATLDLATDDPSLIGQMFELATLKGTDVALAIPADRQKRRGILDKLLAKLFHRVFRTLHGFTLADEAPTARLLTRGVTNSLLQHDAPLVALDTLTATSGYQKSTVQIARRLGGRRLPLAERVRARWRTLIGINAVPLRIANMLCGFGAGCSVLYSLYVLFVYLFKDDVMPGWTTVSLLLSAMFFMFSMVLWLLSEYMVMLLDAGSRRPRYEIAEEFSSSVQTRREQLNVEVQS